jgi:uncharacterized repeat protein (TIGR03806 family)
LSLPFAGACNRATRPLTPADAAWQPPAALSAYGLFLGDGSTQEPAPGVLPYDVNTPLFSDYAVKFRFFRLPPGTHADYHDSDVFAFPVGTVLVKTFAYPHDLRDPAGGRTLVETRLLIHRPDGWIGLPYVWNQAQTEATLRATGGARNVRWQDADGRDRALEYLVPNVNQCKSCHENRQVMAPIGPRARHLNRDGQLQHWAALGVLHGVSEHPPRLPVWNDPASGTLDQRARAWLEINCAHCHNPDGGAKNSGLDLRFTQAEPAKWGVWKTPVAAGRGSGGRSYGLVPGKPDESILLYRLQSTEPGVLMPELGRRLVDEEAVELVRAWIVSLKG